MPNNLNSEDLLNYVNKSFRALFLSAPLRGRIVSVVDKMLRAEILDDEKYSLRVRKDKYLMAKNVMMSVAEAFSRKNVSPAVRKALVDSMFKNAFLKRHQRIKALKKNGENLPPSFLVLSPGKFCNLKCIGCYANSDSASSEKLSYDVLDRIIKEKKELWGSYLTIISGGEPLLWESQGKTIIDIAKNHPDNFFMMYTNSTLVTKDMARKLAKVGNITPAISVEGYEKETDERRGKGVFKKILEAMDNLNEVGVPFGISVTPTRKNCELLTSEEFVKYFKDKGALYTWMFQLMPIGRASFDLVVTPEQRKQMFYKTRELMEKGYFVADFWNCGSVTDGCISAGRGGNGYLYIEWNGNITPCAFNPYAVANINEIYKSGKNLNDVLEKPFLKKIRRWQDDYSAKNGNWILPCPMRDHYKEMRSFIDEFNPTAIDGSAKNALEDKSYKDKMVRYDKELAEVLDPIWEKEYKK